MVFGVLLLVLDIPWDGIFCMKETDEESRSFINVYIITGTTWAKVIEISVFAAPFQSSQCLLDFFATSISGGGRS